ncbi:MAG: cysteine desulfurase [Candidatus Marinimicrobia bacterium]|nr:cysteine desulfurase [Candidatus Neomarinimicrobiota bacterium]MCF7923337.1 cysteine desulfurase [Candidatus Neomarinimicrobiota bacterium]
MLLSDGNIYLDYNATTPIDPLVLQAMEPFYRSHFGNPSSNHRLGQYNRQAIDLAREQVAALVGCQSGEIIFTSGGSESNNFALKGLAARKVSKGQHIIVSQIEHPSILKVTQYLQHQGFRITFLPVDNQGVVRTDDLEEIITSKTILVSVMHANNEIGSIQPIAELTEISKRAGATFHTDAAQSLGKMPVDVKDLGCDLLSMAGHKLYAPKGVGALFVREGIGLEPLIHGANHENGLRAGTENVAQIVGLGMAAEIAQRTLESEMSRLKTLRDRLQASLKQAFPQMRINAGNTPRLPNTLSVSFPQLKALDILADMEEVMLSAGAACHSTDGKGSGVLEAMHIPMNYQLGTIRISLGRFCDELNVRQASTIMIKRISELLEK